MKPQRRGLANHLEKFGYKPSDKVPGYMLTYQQLDNVCKLLVDEGWSGLIGFDDAVLALASRKIQKRHE